MILNKISGTPGTKVGAYGSGNRSGGLLALVGKWSKDIGGGIWGRNNVAYYKYGTASEKVFTHEGVHYIQQSSVGVIPFYMQAAWEQALYPGDPYNNLFLFEGQAELLD